jgi:hypothetical protein
MKCEDCKYNDNCEPRAKQQWLMSVIITGCDEGVSKEVEK